MWHRYHIPGHADGVFELISGLLACARACRSERERGWLASMTRGEPSLARGCHGHPGRPPWDGPLSCPERSPDRPRKRSTDVNEDVDPDTSWFGTFDGVVLVTAGALPPASLAVWALARRRRAAGTVSAWRLSLAEVGMVYGTAPWVWMTMLPGGRAGDAGPRRVNLVPLRDLVEVLAAGPVTATVQVVGNLLVFAALGFFAPLRFAALTSVPRILALAAGCSTPGRGRAVRPAAGPGVVRGRRAGQRRRRRAGRGGVAPLVARSGRGPVAAIPPGHGRWVLSRSASRCPPCREAALAGRCSPRSTGPSAPG